jgi:uncharacterized RDD family membrane protein YckC
MVSDGPGTGPPPGGRPWQEGESPSGAQQSQGAQQPPGAPPPSGVPQSPPVPVGGQTGPTGPVGAGLGARIGARLLDVLIVAIPLSIVMSLVGWGAGAVLNPGGTQGQITSLLQSLLWFAYFVGLESSRGATLGKSIVGIEVQGPDGAPPSVERAMKRNAWMLLGLLPWIGGLLWLVAVIVIMITIASGSNMQGLHDEWATTAVLKR